MNVTIAFVDRSGRTRSAFALMELLVIIGVAGLLAVTVVVSLANSRNHARLAGCAANLGQVNVGLQHWVNDNSGWLPPGNGASDGLYPGQRCQYRDDLASRRNLAFYLATRLGYPAPDGQDRVAGIFFCPAFGSPERTGTNGLCFSLYALSTRGAGSVSGEPGLPWNPFGYPADGPGEAPHKLSEVQSLRSLSSIWMLADLDKLAAAGRDVFQREQLPDEPVHGNARNYLFFDGHVDSKPIIKKEGR